MKFKYRRYYLYYLGRVMAFLFSLLPLGIGLYVARLAGRVVFKVLGTYRRVTIENLKAAFGAEKTDAELCAIAERVFENLVMNGVEMIGFPRLSC